MKFPIKIVYVAGPITSPTKEGRQENIEMGRVAGVAIWRMGAVALVPHLNTLGMFEENNVPGSDIYLGDLELLDRCDAMLCLPGWQESRGTNYEVAWAKYKSIPIFGTLPELETWLNG